MAQADHDGATAGQGAPPPPTDVQERARQGVEHLQAAARELIAAARAALDVAEELVNDPDAAASLAGLLSAAADLARRVAPGAGTATRPEPGDDHAGPAGRVERIPVR